MLYPSIHNGLTNVASLIYIIPATIPCISLLYLYAIGFLGFNSTSGYAIRFVQVIDPRAVRNLLNEHVRWSVAFDTQPTVPQLPYKLEPTEHQKHI